MELFWALIGISSCDQRSMPRHAAAEFAIWLGWWRGEQEFFALTARLINISRGGALVTTLGPPPERPVI
jgi:hypothetical protein